MKHNDRETRQPSAAKIKSTAPPKKSDHAKENRSQPGCDTGSSTASNDKSSERGVIVAAPPDKQESARKRS